MSEDPLRQINQRLLNRYHVRGYLGGGGYGYVYLAMDEKLNDEVALKITRNSSLNEGVIAEAKNLNALEKISKSGKILRFHGVDNIDGSETLFTEYCRGGSLAARIVRMVPAVGKPEYFLEPLAAIQAVDAVLQVCEGLIEAHSIDMIHRDIKPENILLTEPAPAFGSIRLADFGIAKILAGSPARTTIGTFEYTAPEVHDERGVTKLSDIYSTGVTLYRLVTACYPIEVQNTPQKQVIENKTYGRGVPISSFGHVDPALQAVIVKAMHHEPSCRYQSAKEFRDALSELLVDLSIKEAMKSGGPKEAAEKMQGLCKKFPSSKRPYLELAKLYRGLGENVRAKTAYDEACVNHGQDPDLRFEMALFMKEAGRDVHTAITYMRQALKQDHGRLSPDRRAKGERLLKLWSSSSTGR